MRPRVYVIPASPPCVAVRRAFELKGAEHDVIELPNVFHAVHQLLRFGIPTVPAMRSDGEKVAGSRAIMRWLEHEAPDPPLYGRPGVEEAERWSDETFQAIARHTIWWACRHCPDAMPSYLEGSKLPLPAGLARTLAPLTAVLGVARNSASDEAMRADLQALPGHLDRIERWIGEGVIGGDEPTAADLQIGAVLGLLLTIEDVARVVRRWERATALAERWHPAYPGLVPAGVVPGEWLPDRVPSGTSSPA